MKGEFMTLETAKLKAETENNNLKMIEDLLKIVNHYGIDKQLKYIHTEYFELDEAILDCEYNGCYFGEEYDRAYENHIAEEIADIMVMLKQFQYYYEITDKTIENIMKEKVQRQLERIDKE